MSFPTQTILTAGTVIRVSEATAARLPQVYTFNRGGIANGATILEAIGFPIRANAGTRIQITPAFFAVLAANAEPNVGAQDLAIQPYEGTTIATAGAVNSSLLQPILGGDSAGFNITDNEVSTRSFESGLFDDARKVMVGSTIPFSGHYVKGDAAIEGVIAPAAISHKELFVEIEYPDNLKRSGACYVQGYSEENALDNIRRVSWTFRVVGAFNFELVT